MRKHLSIESFLIVILVLIPVFFNLCLLSPELKITNDNNDNVFAYALAVRMEKAWKDGRCPWNPFTCLPKLTDHWNSQWAMGYPLPHYYQHFPSIVNVGLYKLASAFGFSPNSTTAFLANLSTMYPLLSETVPDSFRKEDQGEHNKIVPTGSPLLLGEGQGEHNKIVPTGSPLLLGEGQGEVANYQNPGLFLIFNLIKYLLLCFFPLSVYWAARKFQFPRLAAAFSALCSTFISTNFQYGTDYGAVIWRGSGMNTQLWGFFFLPLALGSLYETITETLDRDSGIKNQDKIRNARKNNYVRNSYLLIHKSISKIPHLLRTVILLVAVFQSHIFFGYIAAFSTPFFLLAILFKNNKLINNANMTSTKTEVPIKSKLLSGVIKLSLNIIKVLRRPVIILIICFSSLFLIVSYWIIPLFLNDTYHAHSVWDELYKFNSFGAREVINRWFDGSLFDYNRFPVLTVLVLIGFFSSVHKIISQWESHRTNDQSAVILPRAEIKEEDANGDQYPGNYAPSSYILFPLLLIFWTLMYFGRTTWGSLISLLPGSEGIHMHRFINGIHFAGIFLSGLGMYFLVQKTHLALQALKQAVILALKVKGENFDPDPALSLNDPPPEIASSFPAHPSDSSSISALPDISPQKSVPSTISKDILSESFSIKKYLLSAPLTYRPFYLSLFSFLFLPLIILFPVFNERREFLKLNADLIKNYNSIYLKEWPDFQKTLTVLNTRMAKNPGRIWAGRPGNWGRQFKLGSQEVYLALSVNGYDTLGFEPESWSPNTDLEQFFNDQRLDHYNLFNIRYIIAPPDQKFPGFAKKIAQNGKFTLYTVQTNGNFDFIASETTVYGNKYNTLNTLRLWTDSAWPTYRNHPRISYSKDYKRYSAENRAFLSDWVSYKPVDQSGNILDPARSLVAQNPFNATPSGIMQNPPASSPDSAKITEKALSNPSGSYNVISESVSPDFFSASVITDKPRLLMLKATYHPFWSATIDSQPVNIQMVAPYYMAVEVPPGSHLIEFHYFPKPYKLFLLSLSLFSLISLLIINTKPLRRFLLPPS